MCFFVFFCFVNKPTDHNGLTYAVNTYCGSLQRNEYTESLKRFVVLTYSAYNLTTGEIEKEARTATRWDWL